jgi:signal transduction histidine kinase
LTEPALRSSRLELAGLQLHHAMELGARLRERSTGARTLGDVAQQLVEQLAVSLQHRGGGAFALVRAYISCDGGLRLAATRGVPPPDEALRGRLTSADLLWPDASALRSDAFFAEFFRQLGLSAEGVVGSSSHRAPTWQLPLRVFHLAAAQGSPFFPPPEYLAAHGVASAFGFGALLPTGDLCCALALSKVALDPAKAAAFEVFALYAKLALLECADVRRALGESAVRAATAEVTEQLLSELQRRLGAPRGREAPGALALEGASDDTRIANELEAQNQRLRRTQRAMLNVVEDLRQVRRELEARVVERTQELVRTNDALQSRNEELQEFVYIASHDLQEPLRTIAGHLQMIQRRYGGKLGTDADEFIGFAIDGAHRMQNLLESLLLYSRVVTKRQSLEPLELGDALDLALENLAFGIGESGARIEVEPLPRVTADRTQMVQLFQNLLSNALKFRGAGPPRIQVSSLRDGAFWRVEVRDQGLGFHPKYADRIFKLFRRLQRGTPGTGIGLSICKKIVERHGGSIGATSEKGAGATFFFLLPAMPEPEPQP